MCHERVQWEWQVEGLRVGCTGIGGSARSAWKYDGDWADNWAKGKENREQATARDGLNIHFHNLVVARPTTVR